MLQIVAKQPGRLASICKLSEIEGAVLESKILKFDLSLLDQPMVTGTSFTSPTGCFAASTPLPEPSATQASQDIGTVSEPHQEQASGSQSEYNFVEPRTPQK